jgi:hypothetical protein
MVEEGVASSLPDAGFTEPERINESETLVQLRIAKGSDWGDRVERFERDPSDAAFRVGPHGRRCTKARQLFT